MVLVRRWVHKAIQLGPDSSSSKSDLSTMSGAAKLGHVESNTAPATSKHAEHQLLLALELHGFSRTSSPSTKRPHLRIAEPLLAIFQLQMGGTSPLHHSWARFRERLPRLPLLRSGLLGGLLSLV